MTRTPPVRMKSVCYKRERRHEPLIWERRVYYKCDKREWRYAPFLLARVLDVKDDTNPCFDNEELINICYKNDTWLIRYLPLRMENLWNMWYTIKTIWTLPLRKNVIEMIHDTNPSFENVELILCVINVTEDYHTSFW
jgi:hypothetical protein